MGSQVAQLIKNPPAMQETQAWFLGREVRLEKGWATHSRIFVNLKIEQRNCSRRKAGTCLAVQWLRFCVSDARDAGLITCQGTKILCAVQLRQK